MLCKSQKSANSSQYHVILQFISYKHQTSQVHWLLTFITNILADVSFVFCTNKTRMTHLMAVVFYSEFSARILVMNVNNQWT